MQDEERLTGSSAFGALLRRHRLAAGLSQEALAERARMSTNGIGALERGYRRSPQRETLALLASALALDGDRLSEFEAAARSQPPRIGYGSKRAAALPSHLPVPSTSFVGREAELEALSAALGAYRLVTIAGPGGMGKTRLALEAAGAAAPRFPDGAWFVDLSGVSDSGLVAQTVAARLDVREAKSQTIAARLLDYLELRRILLVVDNAEHVLRGVSELVASIRTSCPDVTLLVTSREPLHVAEEFVYRLAPMRAPAGISTAASLMLHDGTRLFLQRARSAAPQFAVAEDDAETVASICRKLGCIPLAIELAAARANLLSVRQLDQRLEERLPLLVSKKVPEERHRTLRAAIDWSYRLLNAGEQTMLAQLAVFAHGFTLEACEAIAPARDESTLDVLESLVEKSLVSIDREADVPRFRTLDVVTEFARGKLLEAGDAGAVSRAHAEYFTALAATPVHGDALRSWYRTLDEEMPNLRAALDWCAAFDPQLGARTIHHLAPYWRVRTTVTEARWRVRQFLSIGSLVGGDRAAVQLVAASFANMQDDLVESIAMARDALAFYEDSGDRNGIGSAQMRIAEAELRKGQLDEAQKRYGLARELLASAGNESDEVICVGNLGMICRQRGDYGSAKRLLEEAHQRATTLHEHRIAGEFLTHLGWVSLYMGDLEESRRLFEQVVELKETVRDPYGVCGARHGLATVDLKAGRIDAALSQFVETLTAAYDLAIPNYVFRSLYGVSAVLALEGHAEKAALYLGLAERLFAASGRELRDSIAYDIASDAIAGALPDERYAALLSKGAQTTVPDAIAEIGGRAHGDI